MELVNIGPIDIQKRGGVINAVNETVMAFEKEGCENTNLSTFGKMKILVMFEIYIKCLIFVTIKKNSIYIFHLTFRNIFLFFPLILCLTSLRQKVIIRKFAGDMDIRFFNSSRLQKYILIKVLSKVNKFYYETEFLKNKMEELLDGQFTNFGIWENTRNTTTTISGVKEKLTNNFVFISRISRDKGVARILSVLPHIKNLQFSFDFYGPLEDVTADEINLVANYKGVLCSEKEVIEVLRAADALILPSTYMSEGCPGVLIEAMSVGTPTIVSNWRALPGLIENCGIVLKDFHHNDFRDAIVSIRNNYENLSKESIKRSVEFDTIFVHRRIIKELENIV